MHGLFSTHYWDWVQIALSPFWVDLLHVSWWVVRVVVGYTVWSELVIVTIIVAIAWCVTGVLAEDIVVSVISCRCVISPEDVVTCATVHYLYLLDMILNWLLKVYKFYYKVLTYFEPIYNNVAITIFIIT